MKLMAMILTLACLLPAAGPALSQVPNSVEVTALGWTRGIELCPDHCWPYLSFISELSGELEAYVGTETVVRLRGRLDAEFEGPYVSEVTGWTLQGSCEPVGAEAVSWDGLKASFR